MRSRNSRIRAPLYAFFILVVCLLLAERVWGDARTETVKIICGDLLEQNSSIFVPNYVISMESLNQQIRNSNFAVVTTNAQDAPNGHYGFIQCYGDLNTADCISCFAQARSLSSQCYPFTTGRVYLDGCYLRSDNYSFFQEYQTSDDAVVCDNTTRMGSNFEASARQAVMRAEADAPNNGGYARVDLAAAGNDYAYVLAECWKTLNDSSCKACLENATAGIGGCLPWSEGRVLNAGCFMRYSNRDFFNSIPASKRSKVKIIIIAVSVSVSLLLLVVGVIVGVYIRKRRYIQKKRRGYDARKLVKTLHNKKLDFKYSTLEKATGYFDNVNKLGQGGFGTVYKGLLPDGREIAVKRLFLNNRQRASEFYNEVNIISGVEHKNLVKLLGCSCSGPESLLVYEFLPNKSLDNFIFDSLKGKELDWGKRYKIIIGTAEGLVYLHENSKIRIIHRDIKASNILLDSRLHAKIADFGLARTFQEDKSHISTAIAGTLGYMAPEYVTHGKLTEKADVYSFGVLLLEMVTGRQNNRSNFSEDTESTLITEVWKHFQAGTVEELYDPNLKLQNYHDGNVKIQILRVVHIALLCTQENPLLRLTMSKALQMLITEEILPAPTSPPFMSERSLDLNDICEDPSDPFNTGSSATTASMSNSSFYPR
ncbi:cysteine-rich receptor-like protein kinase 2 isoform X1 [Tripterygium wilfordii]|uniref:cysteine-rich receptor-like protein kinase 2 isoform X1 n=1 Tax=Tripterygium wilfordii TaxID=458696 RepID=UPI0018F7FB67|nr:cysteine-rich receptor-like protein kinase 2 isoform X1 [Tripterygium wilfordii]